MVQSWIGVINLLVVMKTQSSSSQLEILAQQLRKLKKQRKSVTVALLKNRAWLGRLRADKMLVCGADFQKMNVVR
jgi:hypothetical protein